MTSYPGTLDVLPVDILGTDKQSARDHAGLHNDLNQIVMDLETKIGIDGSISTFSHDYKIKQLETNLVPLMTLSHSHNNLSILNNIVNSLGSNYYFGGDGNYHTTHTHLNKIVLDGIVNNGSANNYLGEDGSYHLTHSHSNLAVLNNIINGGPSNKFLAADGLYYTIGGTGASGHDIDYDTTSLPVRSVLNFYGAGVHLYDNAGTDSIDIFIEGANQATGSAYIHYETFTNNTWTIDHELNTTDVIVACYDSTGHYFEFDQITFSDSNHLVLHFSGDVCGKAVILTKGTSGTGGCCDDGLSGYTHSQIQSNNTWLINHNLETDDVIVMVYDSTGHYIEYDDLTLLDNNNLTIEFTDAVVGKAIVLCEMREACQINSSGNCGTIQWNSVNISNDFQALNFIGTGITDVSETSGTVTVNVTGGGTGVSDGVVSGGILSSNNLILNRTLGLSDITIDLSGLVVADNNDYVDSATLNNTTNILTLGRTGILSDLTVDLSPLVGGEDNTTSSVGSGVGLTLSKVGVDLPFKSLIAGTNVTLTDNGNDVTIDVPVTVNGYYEHTQGSASTIWNINHGLVSDIINFRTYDATGNRIEPDSVEIVDSNNITMTFVSAVDGTAAILAGGGTGGSGEVNTASNLGTGEGVYSAKVGNDLQFKSLKAGTNITLTSDSNEVTINTINNGNISYPAIGSPTVINHNLGYYPHVTCIDTNGDVAEMDINHGSINQVTISWNGTFNGNFIVG